MTAIFETLLFILAPETMAAPHEPVIIIVD
jgi:hypothetical protein